MFDKMALQMWKPKPGDRLVGVAAELDLLRFLGRGGSGITFVARVVVARPGTGMNKGDLVVVKTPSVHSDLTVAQIEERLADLFHKGRTERDAMHVLRQLSCVAQIFDQGSYYRKLKGGTLSHDSIPVIVQEYIRGDRLDLYLEMAFGGRITTQHKRKKLFRGVPTAKDFFFWARQIASVVGRVHQRQIIHGDLWQNNFIIRRRSHELVLIDFGQAAFRTDVNFGGQHVGSWMAPEGAGSVAADVYSLGGLLLFLATGPFDSVKERFPQIDDIDQLKKAVVTRMMRNNPSLYRSNCGIADIIARCLRSDRHGRTPNVQSLWQDIELFDPTSPKTDVRPLIRQLRTIQRRSPLIAALVDGAIMRLNEVLIDLRLGIVDLMGDHESIVGSLTRVVALLTEEDRYLTITTPAFWRKDNLGVQGRFLSANRQAVLQRGAEIKRLFLITQKDLRLEPNLTQILNAQLSLQRDAITNRDKDSCGSYEVRFLRVGERQRRKLLREGINFGVLVKGRDRILLVVDYAADGSIGAIQFRSEAKLARSHEKRFASYFASALPLQQLWMKMKSAGSREE